MILSVGRLQRRKGFDMVLRSLPELVREGIDVQYALIGIGEDMSYLRTWPRNWGFRTESICLVMCLPMIFLAGTTLATYLPCPTAKSTETQKALAWFSWKRPPVESLALPERPGARARLSRMK